ncbi:hypothetical protein [Mycobacterium canetti]|uniref:hypothetical protein n=1 Tax=Mycobacterium canetti TaxID=78331 RepID=UPI0002A5AB2A|nr:hypothetical protein [Mycobacterium canetti]CCK64831.1 Conserved protein of unknown function [Mycobacterium canettii CIPT 140070017]
MTAKKQMKQDIAALLAEEAEAIDADRDAPITDATTATRGHGRSKTLQIRLNPEELVELERVAAGRGLPTSTVAREAILRLIRPTEAREAARRRLVDVIDEYVEAFEADEAKNPGFRESMRKHLSECDQHGATAFDVALPMMVLALLRNEAEHGQGCSSRG